MTSPRLPVRPKLTTSRELTVRLPAWNATVRLSLGGDAVLDEGTQPTPGQEAAYAHVFECAPRVLDAIGRALDANLEVRAELQGVPARDALGETIRLRSVHIMNPDRDGQAYVGYGFSCSWDDEHGLGVMTHRERVVRVGGGDTAFLTWVAAEDIPKAPAKKPKKAVSKNKTLRTPTKRPAAKSKGRRAQSAEPAAKATRR